MKEVSPFNPNPFGRYIRGHVLELSASFRGYPLKGKRLEFPEGYRGVVLHERIKIDNDKEDRRLYVTHNFNTMTLWNWDKKPSANDAFQRAMDWIDIAEAVGVR